MDKVRSYLINNGSFLILIAFIFYLIFSVQSLANIPENSNLATIIAGIIGGWGTLLAVLLSTRQTSKIQEDSKKELLRKERKEFGDDIAVLVGRYITDISIYKRNLGAQNIIYSELCKARNDGNLEKEKDLKNDFNNFRANRRIATECYFILKIKLNNIVLSKNLLIKLSLIYDSVNTDEEKIKFTIFDKSINELETLTKKFIDDYVNEVDSLSF